MGESGNDSARKDAGEQKRTYSQQAGKGQRAVGGHAKPSAPPFLADRPDTVEVVLKLGENPGGAENEEKPAKCQTNNASRVISGIVQDCLQSRGRGGTHNPLCLIEQACFSGGPAVGNS
ncbi:MAG: hypothetical protein M1274_08425 [Actinobacteria bacterium]|nr:hypothetical protein [Actinomycetota bacterium]